MMCFLFLQYTVSDLILTVHYAYSAYWAPCVSCVCVCCIERGLPSCTQRAGVKGHAEAAFTSANQVEANCAKKKRQAARKAEEVAKAVADAVKASAQGVEELVGAAVPLPAHPPHTRTH